MMACNGPEREAEPSQTHLMHRPVTGPQGSAPMTIWAMSLIPFACKGSSWSLVHGITNAPQRLPCGQGHACPAIPGQIAGNLAPPGSFLQLPRATRPDRLSRARASCAKAGFFDETASQRWRLIMNGCAYKYYLAPGSLLFEQLGPVVVATRCRVSIDPK